MSSQKKKVEGVLCAYCGNPLEYVWSNHNRPEKQYFCNREHSTLWRQENGIFHEMSKLGKAGREALVPHLKETGHYKAMSEAGRAGRQRVMPQSNREKPRRKKMTS
jgi:hypothetical protein